MSIAQLEGPAETNGYIYCFQTEDEWGYPVLYWSDGVNYVIALGKGLGKDDSDTAFTFQP